MPYQIMYSSQATKPMAVTDLENGGTLEHAQQMAGQAGDTLTSRAELLRQNEILRRANTELLLRAQKAEGIAGENDRLRELVKWQKLQRGNFKLGKVVLRDPANWWRTVQINLGSRDGLSNDLPVLTAEGFLIGRVSAVSLTHSRIVLLGDPNFKVAATTLRKATTASLNDWSAILYYQGELYQSMKRENLVLRQGLRGASQKGGTPLCARGYNRWDSSPYKSQHADIAAHS
jgi:cell shape-determining protein MreC